MISGLLGGGGGEYETLHFLETGKELNEGDRAFFNQHAVPWLWPSDDLSLGQNPSALFAPPEEFCKKTDNIETIIIIIIIIIIILFLKRFSMLNMLNCAVQCQ